MNSACDTCGARIGGEGIDSKVVRGCRIEGKCAKCLKREGKQWHTCLGQWTTLEYCAKCGDWECDGSYLVCCSCSGEGQCSFAVAGQCRCCAHCRQLYHMQGPPPAQNSGACTCAR